MAVKREKYPGITEADRIVDEVIKAIGSVRTGQAHIIIHESRVVQIARRDGS